MTVADANPHDMEPPLPAPSPESLPFWEACGRNELMLQRCHACGRAWFPPAGLCPHCWSRGWTWDSMSGQGVVVSFVVYRRPYHPHPSLMPPYVVAVVELAEGPRLATRLVAVEPDDVRCGMAVEVAFTEASEGWLLPLFRPAVPREASGGEASDE